MSFRQAVATTDARILEILLIEDDEAHAELIQRAFQNWARRVRLRLARSLREARDRLAEQNPDLVITDMRLPDGRGIEIVPCREDGHLSIYPVIVMTSYGDEKVAVEALKAGALDYVVKSANAFADMPHIIERAMREWGQMIAREHAEEQANTRTRKLLALSNLGQQALLSGGVYEVMASAVDLIRDTLAVSSVLLFERRADIETMALRAAAGVPNATRPVTEHAPALGGKFECGTAIEDGPPFGGIPDENWYSRDLKIAGGVSTIIGRWELPSGALCALSDTAREFSENDVRFLDSVANVVGLAIERQRIEARACKLQNELLRATKVRAMDELGTAVAHELNQPLAAVMNYVQASRRLLATSHRAVSQEILQLMDEAVNEAERAGLILRRLRQFIEKGELQRTACDLNEVIREATRLAFGEARDENIEAHFEFEEDLPRVCVDQVQIQLVLFNLVRNAVEALKKSSTRIVTLKTSRIAGPEVEVLVRDTGPGLDPGAIDRLFTEGFSTKEHGMGVGLSISRSIVEAHGGRLWATSTPEGAAFYFTVPGLGADHGA